MIVIGTRPIGQTVIRRARAAGLIVAEGSGGRTFEFKYTGERGLAMTGPSGPRREATSRRRFLAAAGTAAAVPTAALIGVGPLAGTARAAIPGGLPDYAPIPPGALGPALNADGYFVGNINGDLYWVTDSVYQAMFLTTRDGVVLVDAPPTIGHNLLRAIGAVTRANGRPANITHLVYSHSHADHIGASSLLGADVVRIGHSECRRLLLRDGDPNRRRRPSRSTTITSWRWGESGCSLITAGLTTLRTTSSSTRRTTRP